MIRKLVSFAIHQPLFLTLLLVLFIGAGIMAFRSLPIKAFPDVTDVQVSVVTLFHGHAPEEVEKQVTIPLQIELSGLRTPSGCSRIRNSGSHSSTSLSTQ